MNSSPSMPRTCQVIIDICHSVINALILGFRSPRWAASLCACGADVDEWEEPEGVTHLREVFDVSDDESVISGGGDAEEMAPVEAEAEAEAEGAGAARRRSEWADPSRWTWEMPLHERVPLQHIGVLVEHRLVGIQGTVFERRRHRGHRPQRLTPLHLHAVLAV